MRVEGAERRALSFWVSGFRVEGVCSESWFRSRRVRSSAAGLAPFFRNTCNKGLASRHEACLLRFKLMDYGLRKIPHVVTGCVAP